MIRDLYDTLASRLKYSQPVSGNGVALRNVNILQSSPTIIERKRSRRRCLVKPRLLGYALVMGLPVIGQGNSFLADMINKLGKGTQIPFPANEIRTPVDVITLGSALIELAGNTFGGIIHLSGSTKINRYEMGLEIARTLGYPEDMVLSTNSNEMPGRAPRANDASMDNSLARKVLKTPMRTLAEGLTLTLNFKS